MRYTGKTNKYDPDEQLTKNFKMGEFASPDGFIVWNAETEKFLSMLQEFRDWISCPISPSSMYRSPEHNKRIGGASNSMHLQGMAVDIPWRGTKPEYLTADNKRKLEIESNIETFWRKLCEKHNIKGGSLEVCPAHFHLDIRGWDNGRFKVYYGQSK